MALSSAQKASVRLYLGYSDGSRGGGGSDLEGAMDGLSSDAETLVTTRLTSIASIETKLSSSWDRQKVVKAEEVTLAGEGELRALRSEGRRLVAQLAAILGVPVLIDVFSGAGAASGPTGRG